MWARNPLFHNMRAATRVTLTAGLPVITEHYPRLPGVSKALKQLVHSFHKHNTTSSQTIAPFVISRFRHDVDEICALLSSYAACSCKSLPTFRDNLLVPSSGDKK